MQVVVCLRQGADGEINPFDASAYETALRIAGAEITLLSMGPVSAGELLLKLTRLGAKRAILLTDKAFAGADTLATAYALSLAVKKLSPELVICGRQTLIGDTAQTGPMLAELTGRALVTGVMDVTECGEQIRCMTRSEGEVTASLPALITVERKNLLRLPSLRSKVGVLEAWSAADIGADVSKCGLTGSPTRVVKTFENRSGKRRCRFISREELDGVIADALEKNRERVLPTEGTERLDRVFIVTDAPRAFAESVSDDIHLLELTSEDDLAAKILAGQPSAVLWGSDARSKRVAARVAARLGLGLCADCTALEAVGGELIMYRPALSGSIIAKIRSNTRPAMATVRTDDADVKAIVVGAGYGVKDRLDDLKRFADGLNADFAVSRKLVDNGYAPYERQVGLTGKMVSPPVYLAIGISGAVHHVVGIERSGTVIAINPDKNAPIFDYADYGIVGEF
jgi:electron transfer flavoprotein alpha subunit